MGAPPPLLSLCVCVYIWCTHCVHMYRTLRISTQTWTNTEQRQKKRKYHRVHFCKNWMWRDAVDALPYLHVCPIAPFFGIIYMYIVLIYICVYMRNKKYKNAITRKFSEKLPKVFFFFFFLFLPLKYTYASLKDIFKIFFECVCIRRTCGGAAAKCTTLNALTTTQKENANLFVLIYKLQHIESELAAAAAAFFFIEIYVTATTTAGTPNKYKPSYMRGQKWGGVVVFRVARRNKCIRMRINLVAIALWK